MKKAAPTPMYCGPKCRKGHCDAHSTKVKHCKHCKAEFTIQGRDDRQYCNETCRSKAQAAKYKLKKREQARAEKGDQNTVLVDDLIQKIEKYGGITEFCSSAVHLEVEQRRALFKLAAKLPYREYEECHRLLHRCSPLSQ